MSDFPITLRTALQDRRPLVSAGISLDILPEGHVVQVLGTPGDLAVRATLDGLSDGAPQAVRAAGPGQWFIVGDAPKTPRQMTELFAALQPEAFGIDQSAGRVRIRARGPMVERVLAKGTGVDLALDAFPVGRATTTLIGHIAAHIVRMDVEAFEIMVLRGFAESLWDDLALMSAEFT